MLQHPTDVSSDRTDTSRPFPIVAIGSSAGGLEATAELLRELGTDPKLGLVVIHTFERTKERGLVEILAGATPLPVVTAADGVQVQSNHVYVVPPDVRLHISQSILRLEPKDGGEARLPIDRFFEALALDCGGRAVGVVLSGNGFDGTHGTKAIKREGGITLAQDETAEYASMPQNAVASGCVDFILPPVGLARELRRLGEYIPLLKSVPEPGSTDRDYLQILAAMRRASGVDFTNYKHTTIRRRLERRLFFRGLSDLRSYVELLKRDPSEVAALCEEALIHVTGFFRDAEAFETLRTAVFPKLCAGRRRDLPIRVWVPGCSTGEEVYSLAISLTEFLGEERSDQPFKIFGTDLSLPVIDKARAGNFPKSIENEVSEARLQRYFSKSDTGYTIRREVRDACVFAKHDVTHDPPFASMDLVSCRNLMIYLGPELQDRVVALLHYALKEPGFLLLGGAETVRAFPGFTTIDGKNKLYARTSAAPRLAFDFTTPRLPFDRPPPLPDGETNIESTQVARSAGASDVHREADRIVLSEFGPPGVVVTDDLAIVQFRGHTGPFLEHAPGVATLDLLRTAREGLRLPLRRVLDQARSTGNRSREAEVTLVVGTKPRSIAIDVIPLAAGAGQQRYFLVLFEELTSEGSEPELPKGPMGAPEKALEQELSSTRQYLESVIEQLEATNEELKAANEEIVSSNEELRSTNEELQSAKEELQATNEELRTVNDEMRDRSLVATRLSDDLTNVLASMDIAILLVGRDLRLRTNTPIAATLFGLDAADIGRSVGDLRGLSNLVPSLTRTVTDVLERLRPSNSSIQDPSGHWYELSVRPYVTQDGRVDGTVIVTRDVDAERKGIERIEAARAYAESVVDTVREGLVVLDRKLRVVSANKAFLQTFTLSEQEATGRRLDDLGRVELAAPDLSKAIGELAIGATVDGLRIEDGEGANNPRAFLVSARQIEGTDHVLLAFQDVTLIRAYREELRRMAFDAAVTEERERRRIAAALHDQTAQSLALAQIKLGSVRAGLTGEPRAAVDASVELVAQAIAETRTLIFDLSPPILYDLGLPQALAWLAEDLQKRHGLTIAVTADQSVPPLEDIAKGVVFRAVRELLMNVLKHAQAPAATVSLKRVGDSVEVAVQDEGAGFKPEALTEREGKGFGLVSVRSQIARLGGAVTITSAPGEGTTATIRIPAPSSAAPESRGNPNPKETS